MKNEMKKNCKLIAMALRENASSISLPDMIQLICVPIQTRRAIEDKPNESENIFLFHVPITKAHMHCVSPFVFH